MQKPRKNCGFCTCAMFSHCKPARATKPRKMRFRRFKIGPGQSKIRFGASQNGQKTTSMSNKNLTRGQEAAKSEKETPKNGKCANIVPSWRDFELYFGTSPPPLVRTCSMLMQAKHAVGSNTPGAASSAADLEAQGAPKSRPKPEKIDVKKQHIFGIDFGRVRISFRKGFC